MTEETNRKLARLREERDELLAQLAAARETAASQARVEDALRRAIEVLQDGTFFQDKDDATPARVDRADRLIRATPDEVYAALLDPAALEACLPPDGATGEILDMDPRPGGGFRAILHFTDPDDPKTTADSDASRVTFVDLQPGHLVVQLVTFESSDERFGGEMRMTWRLGPEGDGTRVSISATDVPPGIGHEDHEAGLASTLANLAAYLES